MRLDGAKDRRVLRLAQPRGDAPPEDPPRRPHRRFLVVCQPLREERPVGDRIRDDGRRPPAAGCKSAERRGELRGGRARDSAGDGCAGRGVGPELRGE